MSQRVNSMKRTEQVKLWLQSSLVLGVLLMSGCSSSLHSAEGNGSDPQAQSESGKAPTDAVPGASGEVEDNVELVLARDAQSGASATASVDSGGAAAKPAGDAATAAATSNTPDGTLPSSDGLAVESTAVATSSTTVDSSVASKTAAPSRGTASVAEPASDSAVQPSGDGVKYTVKAGDTLMKISWEQYGNLFRWREIYSSNKSAIADPNHVPPGTVLMLSGSGRSPASAQEHTGDQYLIVVGDTLGKISSKVYGASEKWKAIWENNKQLIRDPNKIYAGFYLYYVPEGKKMTSVDEKSNPESESPAG